MVNNNTKWKCSKPTALEIALHQMKMRMDGIPSDIEPTPNKTYVRIMSIKPKPKLLK